MPIFLAHKLTRGLADDRKAGKHAWLRPDAKSQVSVVYENGAPVSVSHVLVSTQHTADDQAGRASSNTSTTDLAPRVLGDVVRQATSRSTSTRPAASCSAGPSADCGVTGRKIIVDTYGGVGRHGGGAFSGKDPSKVDRTGAYFCRFVARQVVKAGHRQARRDPGGLRHRHGAAASPSRWTRSAPATRRRAVELVRTFDFRPGAIVERLNLLRPIYRQTTNYGHFGRPGLPWEA